MSLLQQVLSDAPLVYWPFNESADAAAASDASGNSRPATKVGVGASLGASSVVPGLPYSSLQTGTGYWRRTDEAAFQVGTGDFTFECWMVCTNATSNYAEVFGRDTAATGNGQILYLDITTGAGRIYTAGASVTGSTRLSDGQLHYVVYRRIAGVHSLVVDGVQEASGAAAGSVIASDLRVFVLAGTYTPFQGRMAHFAYHNTGLSDARITSHYLAGLRSGVVVGRGSYGSSEYGTTSYGGGIGNATVYVPSLQTLDFAAGVAGTIASPAAVYGPALPHVLSLGTIASPAAVYGPILGANQVLGVGRVADHGVVFAPAIAGPVTLTSAQQVIALPGATGGTAALIFDGQVTAPIAWNADAATVQAALVALSNLAPGDVVVTMGPWPGAMVVTFQGAYAGMDVPQIDVNDAGLVGGVGIVGVVRPGGLVKPRITVHAMSRVNPNVVEAELTMSRARRWLPELNDTGSGTVTLRDADPATNVVGYFHLLRFSLDEQVRFTSVVRKRRRVQVAPGEESAQGTVLSGPGVLSLMGDGVVYPYGGVASGISGDRRVFNFASPDYDDSGWIAPVVATGTIYTDNANNPITPFPTGKPAKWPDRYAQFIWDRYVGYGGVPVGDCYFRSRFTTDEPVQVEVWGAADDAYELWIDGQLVVSDMSTGVYLGQSANARIFLPAGSHVLGMMGRNTTDNLKAGVWWSVLQLGGDGSIVRVLNRSAPAAGTVYTDYTRVLPYPPTAPGFTPGKVLRLLLEEAQARGACAGITLGCTDTADSDGIAWPVTADIAFAIGMDLLSVVKQLAESYFDVNMSPQLRLDCWRQRGGTRAVPLEAGGFGANLTELTHEGVV